MLVNYFMEIPYGLFYLLLLWGRAIGSLVKAFFCFIKAVLIEPYVLRGKALQSTHVDTEREREIIQTS